MKRFFLFLLALAFMLTGCAGVQDDVTIMLHDANAPGATILPVDAFCVEGALYYDSGYVSNEPARCGTPDGKLTPNANIYEIPKADGEANFGDASFGYQHFSNIAKVLCTDWRIFRKLETDITGYRYLYLVRGTHPKASASSEYLVLANTTDITFDHITEYLFGAEQKLQDIYVLPYEASDPWGVTMWAEDVTPSGITLICEQFGGSLSRTLQTGAAYSLEVWTENQWVAVTPKETEFPIAWNAIAYLIPKNDRMQWTLDFSFAYHPLPAGRYRVGKEVMDFRDTGDYDKKIYYAEFEI